MSAIGQPTDPVPLIGPHKRKESEKDVKSQSDTTGKVSKSLEATQTAAAASSSQPTTPLTANKSRFYHNQQATTQNTQKENPNVTVDTIKNIVTNNPGSSENLQAFLLNSFLLRNIDPSFRQGILSSTGGTYEKNYEIPSFNPDEAGTYSKIIAFFKEDHHDSTQVQPIRSLIIRTLHPAYEVPKEERKFGKEAILKVFREDVLRGRHKEILQGIPADCLTTDEGIEIIGYLIRDMLKLPTGKKDLEDLFQQKAGSSFPNKHLFLNLLYECGVRPPLDMYNYYINSGNVRKELVDMLKYCDQPLRDALISKLDNELEGFIFNSGSSETYKEEIATEKRLTEEVKALINQAPFYVSKAQQAPSAQEITQKQGQ